MMAFCKRCSKEFSTKPSQRKLGRGIYCSRKCTEMSRRTGKDVLCRWCRKNFYAPGKQLQRSKSKHYFCSRDCYLGYKAVHLVREGHPMWKTGENAYLLLMRRERPQICARCDLRAPRLLVVHHIDENRKNNVLSNLVWLCRNCHFLVHKYGEQ
jgi:hypothetical protein